VHDDRPVLFHTRWALSYLRGPLSRPEIERLMRGRKAEGRTSAPGAPGPSAPVAPGPAAARPSGAPALPDGGGRPVLPSDIKESFLPIASPPSEGEALVYRPTLFGTAKVRFVSAKENVDAWRAVARLAPLEGAPPDPWAASAAVSIRPEDLAETPGPLATFAPLPSGAAKPRSYAAWTKAFASELYRSERLVLLHCRELGAVSAPDEAEREFRVRLAQAARERRDAAVLELRERYAPKLARLEERIRAAETRVLREESEYKSQQVQSAVSIGATILGAFLGRRAVSRAGIGRATTAARGVGRAARERGDVARAKESVEELQGRLAELEAEFEAEAARLEGTVDPAAPLFVEKRIAPRKTDIAVDPVRLVWAPHRIGPGGASRPAFR